MIDFHTHILPNQVDKIIKSFGNDEVFKEMFDGSKETSDISKLLKNMSKHNISKSLIFLFPFKLFLILSSIFFTFSISSFDWAYMYSLRKHCIDKEIKKLM